jgi:hypothetical protein
MFQPKLRSLLATTALVSALALIPVHGLSAQPRPRPEPRRRDVAVRIAPSPLWSFLVELLQKHTIRIDPNGQPEETTVSSSDSGSTTLLPSGGF